ncbi:MAG TPA: molecular chaperone TorD family protein, partial [Terriglobales bacterium]|nr:molecular chaperone TorD family protein [Terriglobales bacterium]
MQAQRYNALADLFTYPGGEYRECVQEYEHLEPALAQFKTEIAPLPTLELQELFTRTFDLNPLCCLEIGWHLFGENYERGAFLVRMRQELRRHGVAESTELPDHLSLVLRLLARMEAEQARDFAAACVLPALQKMLAAFSGAENPFQSLLLAVWRVVRGDYPEILISQEPAPLL